MGPEISNQTTQTKALIKAHGGRLKPLLVADDKASALRKSANSLVSWPLSPKQICDLELLLNGAFSPLEGFLNQDDYLSVCSDMRLQNGTLWPMPITLDVSCDFAENALIGQKIRLDDSEGVALAILTIESIYTPNKQEEAKLVFQTEDPLHPGVKELFNSGSVYLGGRIEGIEYPTYYDFKSIRLTPSKLRQSFAEKGWSKVVAFQTRNPMHRAHREITVRAAEDLGAKLLIHPVVGKTKPGDINHFTRVKCYQEVLKHYPDDLAQLSLLPLSMRMGGPREALWHAIIRKNYGCSHIIVGRDHAGPGKDSNGTDFYGPYDAQELLSKHQDELGIEMVPFKMMAYVKSDKAYKTVDELNEKDETENISGSQLRQALREGKSIPEWFSYPAVIEELRKQVPLMSERGFTLFFTGLSGSGKSTIAKSVVSKLIEQSDRSITLLDGDEVRKNLSAGLGFSKEDRNANVYRIGYVAAEITRHKGVAICAPIAPYSDLRSKVRNLVEQHGVFVEIHVSTSLEVCESRDRKGLYAKARRGEILEFTGISDPYEVPVNPELVINTEDYSPEQASEKIMSLLRDKGLLV